MAYKLAQASKEERVKAFMDFSKIDAVKIKMIVSSMCEVYSNLLSKKITNEEAAKLMYLIEKDVEGAIK
jgi:hypothetical protein